MMDRLLFALTPAIFMVALLWWMWPYRSVTIFAFYYEHLRDSQATIRTRKFNRKWVQRSVFGSCTVWHCTKTGARQPTHIERLLADRWALEHHKARNTRWT